MSPEDVFDKIRSELYSEPKHVPGSAIAQSVGGLVDSTTGRVHPGPPSPGLGSALPSPPATEEPRSRGVADVYALGFANDSKQGSKDKKDSKSGKGSKDSKDNKDSSKPKGPPSSRRY